MSVDLVIRDGTLVTSNVAVKADIAVDDGRIVAIALGDRLPPARRIIRADGRYVLPGIIDAHVHFRDPGLTYKEDVTSGSMAAAFGGVTTVLDMPNTQPVTDNAEVVRLRERLIAEKAYVDVVLVGVVTPSNIDQLAPMADSGVIGFKVYTGESVGGISTPEDAALLEAMSLIARTGRRLGFHAESKQILEYSLRRTMGAGRHDAMAFVESRPTLAEIESIQRVALFAQQCGARIHIFHLSSKAGAQMIAEWRAKGVDITTETAPHYLFLPAEEYMSALGSRLRVNPPVRSRQDAEFLYAALLDGTINQIATDHAPHTYEEKTNPDIWKAMSGFIGVETLLPLMLSEAVHKRGMSLNHLVKLCAENPAKTWDLWPRKGALTVGADADIVLIDLASEWTIDEQRLHSKSKVTPWHGWRGRGKPTTTIVRGQVLVDDGVWVADRPRGSMVRPLEPMV